MAALGVVPASRVAMDTSSLLIAFGPPLTFKAPAPKLIISDEFNECIGTGPRTTLHKIKIVFFLLSVCGVMKRFFRYVTKHLIVTS